jgi:hypothetical protein
MPVYVYGCTENKEHDRIETVHGMNEDPEVLCDCGAVMARVPQVVGHYNNPYDTLLKMMDKKYIDWRKWKNGRKRGVEEKARRARRASNSVS